MSFNRSLWGRLGACAEVAGVFFAGGLVGSMLLGLAGITSHPLAPLMGENPDMVAIAGNLAKVLMLQYAAWVALAIVFLLIRKQQPLSRLGFSLNGYTVGALVLLGIGAWALGDLGNRLLWILDAEFNLGTSVPWREALLSADRTAGWWLVMAVGSFGLVPLVEELFWRGYVQSRMTDSFSPAVAILITAAMFTFSHTQYHQADLFHGATLLALFTSSLIMGWLFHKTGSLIPSIVMHATLNFPLDGVAAYIALALMLVIIAVRWPLYAKAFTAVLNTIRGARWGLTEGVALVFLVALMLGLSQAPQIIQILGLACLPAGLAVAMLVRRRDA
ncbi:CPBP family intramembrane glutamic endopeptidase [Kordiimonas sp.]|uniref:CPBP family intramembrane glutamic endopeptidase n=1 Tax=Kordiimonas sp. TaxID=1970157 RepID=UPI003A93C83B